MKKGYSKKAAALLASFVIAASGITGCASLKETGATIKHNHALAKENAADRARMKENAANLLPIMLNGKPVNLTEIKNAGKPNEEIIDKGPLTMGLHVKGDKHAPSNLIIFTKPTATADLDEAVPGGVTPGPSSYEQKTNRIRAIMGSIHLNGVFVHKSGNNEGTRIEETQTFAPQSSTSAGSTSTGAPQTQTSTVDGGTHTQTGGPQTQTSTVDGGTHTLSSQVEATGGEIQEGAVSVVPQTQIGVSTDSVITSTNTSEVKPNITTELGVATEVASTAGASPVQIASPTATAGSSSTADSNAEANPTATSGSVSGAAAVVVQKPAEPSRPNGGGHGHGDKPQTCGR